MFLGERSELETSFCLPKTLTPEPQDGDCLEWTLLLSEGCDKKHCFQSSLLIQKRILTGLDQPFAASWLWCCLGSILTDPGSDCTPPWGVFLRETPTHTIKRLFSALVLLGMPVHCCYCLSLSLLSARLSTLCRVPARKSC